MAKLDFVNIKKKCNGCGKLFKFFLSPHLEGSGYFVSCTCEPEAPVVEEEEEEPCKLSCISIPWDDYRTIPGPPPKNMLWTKDDELMTAALLGDCQVLRSCIARGALLSVVRDVQGGSILHLAVISGNPDAAKLVIDSGAYLNTIDWRDATPLYYACTHPGWDNIFVNQPTRRSAMIELLLQAGADTTQCSVSGMQPWEAAIACGHLENANKIMTSRHHQRFVSLRKQITAGTAPFSSGGIIDLIWRAKTAVWLIRYNRAATMRCFRPHPDLKTLNAVEEVEARFRDCQARHKSWLEKLDSHEV